MGSEMCIRDRNAMVSGFAQHDRFEEALKFFVDMHSIRLGVLLVLVQGCQI